MIRWESRGPEFFLAYAEKTCIGWIGRLSPDKPWQWRLDAVSAPEGRRHYGISKHQYGAIVRLRNAWKYWLAQTGLKERKLR